ncbi:hypothetical protein [Petropleomorpha daqingensis]|uniref:Lipoprotein n=1 Tax=Petropleomorpha daqingensis TaxID=2026353 RepID=A0A853C818_9ACTN|nr:hypothetical protein [Petropleomorpha daqingensis]NYJ04025.1 hypothetical protein [Petropleomorpha daqingensis]
MSGRNHSSARRCRTALVLTAAAVLSAAATCGKPICQVAHPAKVFVHLADGWPGAEHLVLAVHCLPGAECGFAHATETGYPGARLIATTVLRPRSVVVTVTDATTGTQLLERTYRLDYTPIGRQDECGGSAHVLLSVEQPTPDDAP